MNDRLDATRWEKFSNAAETELPEYRQLSGFAVIGFILGLFSALAIVHVGLSFVGGAAALCSVIALVRISTAPSEIAGRGLALTGLVLALFMTSAGVASNVTEQRLLDLHSRQLALQWFEYLKEDEPEKALELDNSGASRRPLDETLWDRYLSSKTEYEALQEFVSKPEVLALLTLGERAEVRHYMCLGAQPENVAQVYAVTYSDEGTKKSFLVQINLVRSRFHDSGTSAWRIASTSAPWKPGESS